MNRRNPKTFFQTVILLVLITFTALLARFGDSADSVTHFPPRHDATGKVTKYEYSSLGCEFKKIVKPDGSAETFSYQELLNKQTNKTLDQNSSNHINHYPEHLSLREAL